MSKGQYYNFEADELFQIYFKEDPILEQNPQFHDSVEFIFITEGSIEAYLDDKCNVLTKGDIFFAESYETHCYKQLSDNLKAFVLVLSREHIQSFRTMYPGVTLPTYMLNKEDNKKAFEIIKQWSEEKERTNLMNVSFAGLLFSALIDKYPLIKRHDYVGDIFLKELLRYIHLHYLEPISLKDLSHELGYTVEYCSKTLKTAIKCNFREYINLLRLRKARELLSDKSLNMNQSEVLYMCGFSSTATYYRVKKQLEGK